MEKLIEIIAELEQLRDGVPQLLFNAPIVPRSMIATREDVLKFKKKNKEVREIDFILNSPGGSADDAYRIIRMLRNNFETVNIIVPFWAKSAATLLALGGSKIIMDEFGEFGPLDAQIGKERDDSPEFNSESALNDEHSVGRLETRFKELFESMYGHLYKNYKIRIHKTELAKLLLENASKFYEPLLSQIDPYRLGEKRRVLDVGANYAERILVQFNRNIVPEKNITLLVDYLVNGCSDHGYIIDYEIISELLNKELVFRSDVFGEEYKNKLSELSGLFIEHNDIVEVVGFINRLIIDSDEDDPETVNNSKVEKTENTKGENKVAKTKKSNRTIGQNLKSGNSNKL